MKRAVFVFLFIGFCHPSNASDLLDAFRSAEQYDARYASAQHAKSAGREKRLQGKSLQLPQIHANASYSHVGESANYEAGSASDTDIQGNTYGYGISASYAIYNNLNRANSRQLEAQSALAENAGNIARRDLILRVTRGYFDFLIAKEKLTSVLARKSSVGEQLNRTKKSLDLGLVTINDFLEASAAYDRILSDEIFAQNQLEIKRSSFENITGKLPGSQFAVLAPDFTPQALDDEALTDWMEAAKKNNSRIIAQKYILDIAKYETGKYKRPATLELLASYGRGWDDEDLSASGGKVSRDHRSVGLQLSIPIYTGGNISSSLRESAARVSQQKDLLVAANREVSQAVYDTFLQVNASVAHFFALKQLVISTEKLLHASKVSRDAGLRTTSDVLRADENYHAAKFELIAAGYEYVFNKMLLADIAGVLSKDDLMSVNALLNKNG